MLKIINKHPYLNKVIDLVETVIDKPKMIFQNHSDYTHYYKDLKMIGYWYSHSDPDFPNPKKFVDHKWDKTERQIVIAHLKNGKFYEGWMGWSNCRFCGCNNGYACLTDGVYVFPEGFAHYVEEHDVKPDQEFIDYVSSLTKGK